MRVVRIDETDVADCAGQQHARTDCGGNAITVGAVLITLLSGIVSRRACHLFSMPDSARLASAARRPTTRGSTGGFCAEAAIFCEIPCRHR